MDVLDSTPTDLVATACGDQRASLVSLVAPAEQLDERDLGVIMATAKALCRLHHGAYDHILLHIRHDHLIEIAPSRMAIKDGPVLGKGIKAFHKLWIRVPNKKVEQPRPDCLEARYELFQRGLLAAGAAALLASGKTFG